MNWLPFLLGLLLVLQASACDDEPNEGAPDAETTTEDAAEQDSADTNIEEDTLPDAPVDEISGNDTPDDDAIEDSNENDSIGDAEQEADAPPDLPPQPWDLTEAGHYRIGYREKKKKGERPLPTAEGLEEAEVMDELEELEGDESRD